MSKETISADSTDSLENPEQLVDLPSSNELVVKLSSTLSKKLSAKSLSEGISINELACELIAEGLVLRAWEIMERKNTMRKQNSNNAAPQNGRNSNPRNNFQKNQASRRPNNNRRNNAYNNIFEDNANFIDYVRKQEKKKF